MDKRVLKLVVKEERSVDIFQLLVDRISKIGRGESVKFSPVFPIVWSHSQIE